MLRYKNKVAQWAFDIIASFAGQIVVVYFIKRTTGERRRMACVWNEDMAELSSTSKNLLTVWDCEKQAYRNISMNQVKKIVAGGIDHDYESFKLAEKDQKAINEYNRLMKDAHAVAGHVRRAYGLN